MCIPVTNYIAAVFDDSRLGEKTNDLILWLLIVPWEEKEMITELFRTNSEWFDIIYSRWIIIVICVQSDETSRPTSNISFSSSPQ